MKNMWLRSAAAAAVVAAVATGLAGAADAKQLKAAHYLPPKHPVGVGYQTFADEVKKNTNGEITVRLFPGESLLGAKAISDGIRDRVADLGFDTLTYTPSYYPHGMLVSDLAMVGENDMAAAFAYTELFTMHCQPCRAEFEKQNQIFLSGMSTPPYVLVMKGDANSLEKLKGKKLRAGGPLWDRFAQYVGATGVNIPTSEMYEAMSRGILDGAIYAVGGLKTHGLGDVATQVIMLNLGSFRAGNLYSFNREVWSDLKPEQRAGIMKAIPVALVKTVHEYHKGEEEGVAVAKQKNIPVVLPDPGLLKAKNEFVEKDLPVIIESAKTKLGIADPAGFVAKYRELYAKYEKLVIPVEQDAEKVSQILYTEVFAKLGPSYGVK